MKKLLLLSIIASSALFADMGADMAKDAAVDAVKTEITEQVAPESASVAPESAVEAKGAESEDSAIDKDKVKEALSN